MNFDYTLHKEKSTLHDFVKRETDRKIKLDNIKLAQHLIGIKGN